MMRSNTCGELSENEKGKKVALSGWVNSRRDHGGVVFIDLRDRYGFTQVVFDPSHSKKVHEAADKLRREDVVFVSGMVRSRPEGMENPKMKTGRIEILADNIEILNRAETPPIEIDDRVEVNEDIALTYRYLELRKPKLQRNLALRHMVCKIVRDYFDAHGFLEIETPILAKSTPEGARDYLVPSRVNPGKFYALPQSPQLFKQLCMVAGLDRYFQIAKCFRDEDLRADRQPEFTQIDVEMSFIEQEDIQQIIEGLIKEIWKKAKNADVKLPLRRMPYDEAIGRYGSDKPDLRFGLELVDVTEIVKVSEFKVFTDNIKKGGVVKAINARGCASFSRKDIDELTSFVQIHGAKGLAWAKYDGVKMESSVVKYFSEGIQKEIIRKLDAKKGDLLMFVSDQNISVVNSSLGNLRLNLGKKLGLIDESKYEFLWVVDFPLVEYDNDAGRYTAMHHPFTSPKDIENFDKEPLKAKAKAYDIVLNGTELGGGSIRIHQREVQERLFGLLGIGKEEAEEKFGFLLGAFKYGAPPHGGIALGLDRMIALLSGADVPIRDVIAFPKNKQAQSLMDGAPSGVSAEQLRELHIKPDIVEAQPKEHLFGKIRESLDREKIVYEVLEHKAVFTSEEAAKVRGTQLRQGCKALVCKADGSLVQVVVPGDREIDAGKVKKELKVKDVNLANADDVKRISGCSIGAVPPFGNLFGLKVYFDKKVQENDEVAFNAGLHTKSIKMKAKDLIKVTGGVVKDFSK
ncbi:aspartate--tRNA ligase [Candidatus Woesearchaeota archaeon]|nr:aspartate--tRNA ligase [Candidatus Woesearchaeota archaeon]